MLATAPCLLLLLLWLASTAWSGGAPGRLSSEQDPAAAAACLARRASGCGARAPGEACGVYTPGCAPGLRCVPRPGERAPLHALLRGKGLCSDGGAGGQPRAAHRPQAQPAPPRTAPAPTGLAAAAGAASPPGENRGASHFTPEPLPLQSQNPLQEVPVGKAQLEQFSLNSDAKDDLDTAPCRMHLAAILQELKAPLYLNGEDIFIPNCDTKGFYRRKQCLASKGQKRGQCWCVDKRGRRLEGLEENPLCLLANSD